MGDYEYRLLYRWYKVDEFNRQCSDWSDWEVYKSYGNKIARYTNLGTVKGFRTTMQRSGWAIRTPGQRYEYKIQRRPLENNWEDIGD